MGAFTRDPDGIAQWLKSNEAAKGVSRAAAAMAAQARAITDLPITTGSSTSDRATARIEISHPAGMADQAKHGTLTRAAAAIGLQVRGR